jgi:predicted DNA-binding transcriptional regulator AlpA
VSVTSDPPRPPGAAPAGQLVKAPWRYLGLSRSKFSQLRKRGLIPPPVDLPGQLLWRRADLDAWLAGLPAREGPAHAA